MIAQRPKRLTRDDWLAAGAKRLAAAGAEALKAEPMARHMKTTKGSFYWHFKDVPDFHDRILSRWETSALADLSAVLDGETGAVPRLRALAQSIAAPETGSATESAMRSWATTHAGARAALARVDEARLAALQDLLSETGIGNPEMARIIYAAGIGMERLGQTGAGDNHGSIGSLVDLVLALR
ncbi:MAG: TetR/AcrR family transcriptional regulator [Roseovarius sp.]